MEKICFNNYRQTRKALKKGTYDLLQDSIGYCSNDNYSVDVMLEQHYFDTKIDFYVYKNNQYYEGGVVCDINELPLTEHGFWKLVDERVNKFIDFNCL